VLVALVVGLSACGEAGSSVTVVRVGGRSITKAMVDHWIKITAITSNERIPRGPAPAGVVPDPPAYTACIARLAGHPQAGTDAAGGESKPGVAVLRSRCRADYSGLRAQALRYLIDSYWLTGESARLGIAVSQAELARQFARTRKALFPSEDEFRRFFAYSGETLADRLLGLKLDILSEKLRQRLLERQPGGTAQQRQQAVSAYLEKAMAGWILKTSCEPGYVVAECRQYAAGHG
jgi:hypothetical protein